MAEEIVKGKIGNALTSTAADHVLGVTDDIYDENLGEYQSNINLQLSTTDEEGNVVENPIKVVSTDEYLCSIVDTTGKQLLSITKTGQVEINNTVISAAADHTVAVTGDIYDEDIQKYQSEINKSTVTTDEEGNVVENPLKTITTGDYLCSIIDVNGNKLFSITKNGGVEVCDDIASDSGYGIKTGDTDYLFGIVDANGELLFCIDNNGNVNFNGIPDDVQTELDSIQAEVDTVSSRVTVSDDGSDYLYSIVDANGTVLFSIDSDGNANFQGVPDDVQTELDSIQASVDEAVANVETIINEEVSSVIRTDGNESDTVFAILDKNSNVLASINSEGQFIVDKGVVVDGSTAGVSVTENGSDSMLAVLDKNNNVLASIGSDGALMANSITGVCDVNAIDNENYVLAVMDRNGNVLFGVLADGTFYAHNSGTDNIYEDESHEFLFQVVSSNGKLLFGVRSDGSIYCQGITEGAKEAIEAVENRVESLEDTVGNLSIDDYSINNKAINKVMYDGNLGKSYLGNVTLQEPGKTDYCIIMMYGQSLSNGSESSGGYWDDPLDRTYMLGTNVQTLSGSILYPLSVNGNNPTVYSDRGNWCSGTDDAIITAVRSFANLYKKERPWDTNTKFIACSLGVGGRTVAQLSGAKYKDGSTALRYPTCNETQLDTRVKTYFESVKAIADAEGASISLSAVFWMQGEADYGTTYLGYTYDEWKEVVDAREETSSCAMSGCKDAYYQGLTTLKEDIFALAKDVFGDDQEARPLFMPYSVCGTYISNAYMTINEATREMAEDQWDVCQVGPTYQVPDYSGGHLSLNGYRWYGEYCAKALYEVFLKGINHKPMQPYNYEVVGNQVYIYINAATLPLRFDMYTCGNTYKDKGFTVRAGTVAQLDSNKSTSSSASTLVQTITDISIVENAVVITCAGDLSGYGAVEVIYAGQGQSGYSGHNQGAGNLRDSDEWTALHDYRDDSMDMGNQQSSYWSNGSTATEEQLETLEYWDSDYASSTGYSTDDQVLYDIISNVSGPVVMTSLVDSNKTRPYHPVSYRAQDVKGNVIVGNTYPMKNWCLNFYKRIVQG